MHILIDSMTCNPHQGSNAEAGFGFTVQALKRNTVYVISHRELFLEGGNPLCGREGDNLVLSLVSPGIMRRFGRQTDYLSQCYFYAKRILKKYPVDIIHTVEPTQYRMIRPLAYIGSVPFVLGPLNGGHAYPPQRFLDDLSQRYASICAGAAPRRRGLGRIADWVNNQIIHGVVARHAADFAFQKARRIIIGTMNCLTVIAPRHHAKCVHVPCFGIDVDTFRPALQPTCNKEPVILYAGRITEWKGLDLLLRACAKAKGMPLRVRVAGSGAGNPDDEAFEQYCRNLTVTLGMGEQVEFLGHVPRQNLAEHYRRCDMFCLPSLWEPFGLVYLEAMASGVPVIGMASGGPAEILKPDFGYAIAPRRLEQFIDDLAEVIKDLAGDAEKRRSMGRCARHHIMTYYSWDVVGMNMQRVYENAR